ncbi:hypothetical protein LTR37_009306 [Vermiconidia calcicola]|uniref:Uncharacterized protein n=1 Tax=Vermiconidia calcicola TaxID=1690605 RepID=A0ACC3N854_9PEZI|nr:hypothetical protein LTR37_009306 [Vermiconidia calcicola]
MGTRPRNIFIIGAQCTGKTTLVYALKEHFERQLVDDIPQPVFISELARNVMKQLKIDRHEIATLPERSFTLQKAILHAQDKAEIMVTNEAGGWYISDRSGIDPIVYTRLLVGEDAATELLDSEVWSRLQRNMKDGLVFLCEDGCTWLVDDGTRLMPKDLEDWSKSDHAFRKLLEEKEIGYTLISKDVADIADRLCRATHVHGSISSTVDTSGMRLFTSGSPRTSMPANPELGGEEEVEEEDDDL